MAELAYAHDSGSCEHYARVGSSPTICTMNPEADEVSGFFCFIGNVISMKQKKLREDAHCAREEDVADATALGARISRARFFVHYTKRKRANRQEVDP